MNNRRESYYDLLRIICAALVIFNHTLGYLLFMYSSGIIQFLYICSSVLAKIAVPTFFMISGALLLKKEDSYKKIMSRLFRFVLVILLFSFTYEIIRCQIFGISFSISSTLRLIISNKVTGPYWYLYAYCAFLLFLPILQKMTKVLQKKDYIAMVVLRVFFFCIIPVVNLIITMFGRKQLAINSSLIGPFEALRTLLLCPILGYYIDNKVDVKNLFKKKLERNILIITTLSCFVLPYACTLLFKKINGYYVQDYLFLLDAILAAIIFMFVKWLKIKFKFSQKINKAISTIGSLTFGIYLLEPILKLVIFKQFTDLTEPTLSTMTVSWLWVLLSMILCGIITYLLKKVILLKKII